MKKVKIVVLLIFIILLASTFTYTVYAVLTASVSLSNRITFNTTSTNFFAGCQIFYEGYENEILSAPTLDKSGNQGEDLINEINIPDSFKITSTKNVIIFRIVIQNYSDYSINVALNIPPVPAQFIGKITKESSAPVNIEAKTDTVVQSAFVTLKVTFLKSASSFVFDNSFSINITENT
ncbi:MAG: hypothetical protein PHQ62_01340 [Clostridia bacterium]|nr:hypothetical protein [Clostridia bacterium]